MSDLLTDGDLRTEREPVKEPPRKWRNWWRSRIDWMTDDGVDHWKGRAHPGSRIWPSKDAAETAAARELEYDDTHHGFRFADFLGALPDGEAP